ncbi:hypothetical protein ABPG73_023071 [Tetrahymena malaccensis]
MPHPIYIISNSQKDLLLLIVIILLPLSYKLGNTLSIEWYNYINIQQSSCYNQMNNSSPFKIIMKDNIQLIDIFCRQLVKNIKQKIVFSNLETSTILFSSQIYYSENQSSECGGNLSEYSSSEPKKQSKLNIEFESKQSERESENKLNVFNINIIRKIMRIYSDAIDSKAQKDTLSTLDFSYLTLVSSAYHNHCFSLLKIFNARLNSRIRDCWKDQQKIETLFKFINDEIQIENKKNKKESNQFEIHSILKLEQIIKQINKKYLECMRQYQIVITILSKNFIDINDALLQMTTYREKRNQLQNLIIEHLPNNCNNNSLKNLCIKFDFYLLHKKYLSLYYQKLNTQKYTQEKYTYFQNEQNCFAFVSLLENSFGRVKNANKTFIKTLGFTNKSQIIGQPIFSIFPKKIQQIGLYNKITSRITENYIRKYNQIADIPLFIARNNQGYSQPFQVNIQSQIIDQQDFGLTIWAKPIIDDNIYIILDQKDPNIIKLMSKTFKQEFLTQNQNSQNLKMTRMNNFIPIINYLIKKSQIQQNKKFETLLIKNQMSAESLLYISLEYPNFLNSLLEQEIFSITVSFQIINNKITQYIILIIENYKSINSFSDKIHFIKQYQIQIEELCGLYLKFDYESNKQNILKQQDQQYQLNSTDLFKDRESNCIRQKCDNSQYESTTIIQNIQESNSYAKLSQRNPDIVYTIEQDNYLSQRPFIDSKQIYPDQNQGDYVIDQQSSQIQDLIIDQQRFSYRMNDSKFMLDKSKEFSFFQNQRDNTDFSQIIKRSDYHSGFEINEQHKTNEDQISDLKENQILQFVQKNNQESISKNQSIFSPKTNEVQQDQSNVEISNLQLLSNNLAQKSKQTAHKQYLQQRDVTTTGIKSRTLFALQEEQRQKNQDVQSVSSSTKSVQNKQLFDMIYQKKQIRYLKFVNIFGIVSLLVIITITLYEFLQFYLNVSYQRDNFKYINWIYMINVQLSYALSERNIILLNQNNLLSTPASLNQTFVQLLEQQDESRINLSKQYLLLLYNNTNPNIQVFNIIKNQYILQQILSSKKQSNSYNISMLYSIAMQTYGIFYFVSNKDTNGVVKTQNEQNYQALNDQVQLVFSQMNDYYVNQLNLIQSQSLFQLYATILISFFCLLNVIPSYKLIKVKQQKILELFATFERQDLQQILQDINYQLSFCKGFSETKQLAESNSSLESYLSQCETNKVVQIPPVLIEKKLNISRTSNLKYSLKYLTIGVLAIFCLISLYPLVNYLLINQFINNSSVIFNFNNVVCKSYFFILNSLRARQGLATAFLLPAQQSVSVNTFQNMLTEMTETANQLPDLIQDNLGKISSTKLINQSVFNDYLVNVYTGNACDTLSNYTQYQNGDFQYTQCTTVGKGSLLKGLLNGVIFFISIYKDYMTFAMSQNATQFQQSFNQYNKNIPALQIDKKTWQDLAADQQIFSYVQRYIFFLNDFISSQQNNISLAVSILFALNSLIAICFIYSAFFQSRTKHYFFQIISQVLQSYQYLIALPSFYISIQSYQQVQSLINMILTLIIGSLIVSQDYDYSFTNEDILQKKDLYFNVTEFYLDIILCTSSSFFDIYMMIISSFAISVLKLLIILKSHNYINKNLSRWLIILGFFKALLPISLIVYILNNTQKDLLLLIVIILMPLSYKLGNTLSIEWYNYINIEQSSNDNQINNSSLFKIILNDKNQLIDIFCRQLVSNTRQKIVFSNIETSTILFSSQIYYSENQSSEYERNLREFSSSEPEKQSKMTIQFESKENERESSLQVFNIKIIRKVMKIYQDIIDSKGQKDTLSTIDFSYMALISTAYQNQCFSLLKILNARLNSCTRQSWKDQQKFEIFLKCVDDLILIHNQKNKKESNQFQFYKILEQEQYMKQINKKYFECLRQYQIIVSNLSKNFIDINDAFLQMTLYREQRNQLQNCMVAQLQKNCNSEILKNMCIKFDFYLLHKKYLSLYFQKLNIKKYSQQKNVKFVNEQSCLAFVSLLENSFGIVKNANKNFIKTLGFTSNSQIVGQSIFSIFPKNILQKLLYTKITSQITEGYIHTYNQIVDIPLFIARNNQGYSQPFQVKIQSQIINQQDFGLAICAQPIQDDNIYIILDYKDPCIIKLMSKTFNQEFLSENIKTQDLKLMRMDSFVPIINDLVKVSKIQQNKKFETLLIKQEKNNESLLQVNLQHPHFLNSLLDAKIFAITVSFQIINTKIASYVTMIIENYKFIGRFSDKIHYLNKYQIQINELCGFDLSFDDISKKGNILKKQEQQFKLNSDIRQKFDTNQQESTTIIQNMYNSSLYIKQSQRNQDIINTNEYDNSQSHRCFIDNQQNQHDINQGVINMQSSKIQNMIFDQKWQNEKLNDSKFMLENSKEFSPQQNNKTNTDFSQIIKRFDDLNMFDINESNKINQYQLTDNYNNQLSKRSQKQENNLEQSISKNQSIFSPKPREVQQDLNNIENSNQQLLSHNLALKNKQQALVKYILQRDVTTTGIKSRTLFAFQEEQRNQNQDVQSVSSSTKSTQNKENFKYINWIYMINVQLSYALSERNIILLNQNKLLSTPASLNQTFVQLLDQQNESRINLSKQYLLLLYNNTNPNIQVFNIIKSQYILQKILFSKTQSSSYNMSMIYSIVMQTYGVFYFVSNKDAIGVVKRQNEENYQILNDQVQLIFSQMNDDYVNQLNSIQSQSIFQLYATIFVSFFCLLNVIPSYKLIKVKQQKILELLATFDRQELQQILQDLNYQLSFCRFNDKKQLIESNSNLENSLSQSRTNKVVQTPPVQIEKKLNISRTSSLKYSLKCLIIGVLAIFCLISIYPLVNYLLINRFIDNSSAIFNFNNVVCKSYFFILNSLRARQGLATAFLLPAQQSVSVNTFQSMLSQMTETANQLPDLIQNNLGKIGSINLINKSIFNDYLVNVFTGNACDTISNYTQYQNGDFQYNQCTSVGKGSLLKGLLNGVMFFISIYKDYMTFAMSQNATQFQQSFNNYNKNIPAIVLIQLQIDQQTYKELASDQKIFSQFIAYFLFLSGFSNSGYNKISLLVEIIFAINCFIIVFLIFSIFFKSRIKKGLILLIFSQIMQTYQFLIALPSFYISMQSYQQVLSLINVILTLAIGSISVSLDYDYTFDDKDMLQKKDSHFNSIEFYLDFIHSIINSFFDIYMVVAFSFVSNAIKLVIILKSHNYLNKSLCRWQIILAIFRCLFTISVISHTLNKSQKDILLLIIIIIIPLSFKIGDNLSTEWYNYINIQCISNKNQIQDLSLFKLIMNDKIQLIDVFCRQLVNNTKQKLIISNQETPTITFSTQIYNQNQSFKGEMQHQDDCLKERYIVEQDDENSEKENFQITFNLKAIKNIMKTYLDAIQLKGGKQNLDTLDFSYLTLVSTFSQNQSLSIIKILNASLNTNIRLGWKDQQKIETIMRCANAQIEISNKQNKKDKNSFQIHTILEQDQKIKELESKYFECLKQQQIIIEKLSVNFIDINNVFQLMIQYREQRDLLKSEIIRQIQSNSNNNVLKNLSIKFDHYLLYQQNISLYQKKLNRLKGLSKKYTQFQTEQCGLAFISLLENQFGFIKNANKFFMKVLGFTNKSQIIGQSILSIFPQNLIQKRLYNKIISQITEKYIPTYNLVNEIPLVIARNNNGYSQPFQVKFQSQKLASEDFGLTIWANPIQDDKIYMILDQKDPSKIKLMSNTFQQEFYTKQFNKQNQKIERIDSFIPIILDLIKLSETQQNRKFETLLIKPEMSNEHHLIHQNLNSPNFLNTLMQSQIYSITVSFQIFNNKLAQFIYMIIENYKPISFQKDKLQYIQLYQMQIKELCGKNLTFDNKEQIDFQQRYQNTQLKTEKVNVDNEVKNLKQNLHEKSQNESTLFIQNIQDISSYNIQTQRHQDINTTYDQHNSQSNRYFYDTQEKYPYQPDYVVNLECSKIQSQVSEQSQIIHKQINESLNLFKSQSINASPQNFQNKQYDEFYQNTQKSNKSNEQNKIENNNQFKTDYIKDSFVENSYNYIINRGTQYDSSFDLFTKNKNIFSPNQGKIQQGQDQIDQSNQKLFSNNMYALQSKQQANNQFQQMEESNSEKLSRTLNINYKHQKQQNQDVHSVSSSTKSVQDKQLFELIYQKKQSGFLKLINLFGLASLLVIITITIYEFLTYFVNLSSQRENFKFINWIYLINVQFSYALSGINMYTLNQNNLYLTPQSQNNQYVDLMNYQNNLRMNLSKQYLLYLYNNTNPDIQIFKIIQNKQIPQNVYSNIFNYDQYNMSIIYSMLMQTYGIYYFVSNQDLSGIIKKQNEENYVALNSQVEIIFSEMNNEYLNQLNSLQKQSVFQLYSTIFVSLFSLLSVIPGYILIKARQQKTLELFATFDRQDLQQILSELAYQLSFCKGFDEKNKPLESKSSLQSHLNQKDIDQQALGMPVNVEKKLNISRTSNIQYSLKYLIFGLVCIFCLISIYPLVNYILINSFIDDSQLIFNFNDVVCKSYFFILNSIRARQGLAEAFLLPSQQSISVISLQNMLSQLMQQADQLPSQIQDYIGKVGSRNIYNKDIFKNYLIKVYSDNACDTMQNYTQYQNGDFLYDQCCTVGKGNLQRGLLNGIVFFISVYKEFMNFALSKNATEFQQSFNQFNLNTPAYKQFQFRIELSKAHEYLMNFFQDQNLQLYNYYEQLSTTLVLIQISFVVLVFTVCWFFYFKKLNQLITQTRQLLDVFPHKTIFKNTYIMSYLRRNQ